MTLLAQGLDLTRMHEHPSARSGLELVRVSLWYVHAQVGLKCVYSMWYWRMLCEENWW
jgi:hypothetical protein